MATVAEPAEEAQYKISAAPDRDDWDRWNSDRDHMIHSARSHGSTPIATTRASEDLDANGRWENVPDYGQMSGCRTSRRAGRRIAMATGSGNLTTAGLGWAASLGAGRRITTAAGCVRQFVGLVAGTGLGRGLLSSILGAGLCFVLWLRRWVWLGFGVGFGGWGGFGWLPIGPCDRFFPWWGGYGGRFGVVGFNRFGGLNRFGGIAPLHGGTRFSNVAHINDPHIGRSGLDGGCGTASEQVASLL